MSRLLQRESLPCEEALVARVCAENDVSPLLARALIRRGVTERAEVQAFLHPHQQPLPEPGLLADMDKAAMRIRTAIANGEKLCVYGDYDADGVCATALLVSCLKALHADASYYLPSRHAEGYGLSRAGIDALHEAGVRLIITVDNGLSAHEEIAYAGTLGMDVVVTDHHRAKDTLPSCAAVVRPQDGGTPFCGAGVAYLLARALTGGEAGESALALAAVASVADVVPLTGHNRVLVAQGMPLISRNPGLAALLHAAQADKEPPTETTLAFALAPRLNAAGRMGDAARAVELLTAQSGAACTSRAEALETENQTRRRVEAEILVDAEAQLAALPLSALPALVLCGRDWNPGVIGIVASRLAERYNRPALLFCGDNGELTGSCRSVPALDMAAALAKCSGFFTRFGGHAGAAGITMPEENLPAFTEAFLALAGEALSPEDALPAVYYEEAAPLSALTLAAAKELMLLSPFGEGNERPCYLFSDVCFSDVKRMGKDGKHISVTMRAADAQLRLVAFGAGALAGIWETGERFEVIASPSVNRFRGTERAELLLCAANARICAEDEKYLGAFWNDILYNSKGCDDTMQLFRFDAASAGRMRALRWERARMRTLYQALTAYFGGEARQVTAMPVTALRSALSFEQQCALMVFTELGFFRFDADTAQISAVRSPARTPLERSGFYRLAAGLKD